MTRYKWLSPPKEASILQYSPVLKEGGGACGKIMTVHVLPTEEVHRPS